MKKITVTGLKPMELTIFSEDDPRIEYIKRALEKRLLALIDEGLEWVLVSGQMGIEMWTTEVVLALQEAGYAIQIAMFPPFENMHSRWPEALQMKYEALTGAVDFHQSVYKGDYQGPYQFRARDQFLTDHSDGCLMLLDQEHPASVGYFLDHAKTVDDYPIYFITPDDLNDVIEEMRMADPNYWNQV